MAYRHLKFPEDSLFLVTGAAGFIGCNLCEAILEMGYRVRALDDFSTGKQEEHRYVHSQSSLRIYQG